jgi:hypothetical protein
MHRCRTKNVGPAPISGHSECQNRLLSLGTGSHRVAGLPPALVALSNKAVPSLRSGVGIIFLRAPRRHFPVRSPPAPTIWREYPAGTGRPRERIGDELCRRVHKT